MKKLILGTVFTFTGISISSISAILASYIRLEDLASFDFVTFFQRPTDDYGRLLMFGLKLDNLHYPFILGCILFFIGICILLHILFKEFNFQFLNKFKKRGK